MKDYLGEQILIRQQRLATLEAERSKLLAEIHAYGDALAHLSSEADGHDAHPSTGRNASGTTKRPQIRRRSLSNSWAAILSRLSSFERFTSRDVGIIARRLGFEQSEVNIRSQLSNYTQKMVIKRLGLGSYVVSDATKKVLSARQVQTPGHSASHKNIRDLSP